MSTQFATPGRAEGRPPLYRLRGELRLTQAELAERLGVTRQLVSMIETGRAALTFARARQLRDLFPEAVAELGGLEGLLESPEGGR